MAWGTKSDYWSWLGGWVRNTSEKVMEKVDKAKNNSRMRAGKCWYCKRRFGDYDVPKWVNGHEVCRSCAAAMGIRERRNLIAEQQRLANSKKKATKK